MMGMALGVGLCSLAVLINPSDIVSLITHDAEPGTVAIILVCFLSLFCGVGAVLTGIVITEHEQR
jgi:hypothetical protein